MSTEDALSPEARHSSAIVSPPHLCPPGPALTQAHLPKGASERQETGCLLLGGRGGRAPELWTRARLTC